MTKKLEDFVRMMRTSCGSGARGGAFIWSSHSVAIPFKVARSSMGVTRMCRGKNVAARAGASLASGDSDSEYDDRDYEREHDQKAKNMARASTRAGPARARSAGARDAGERRSRPRRKGGAAQGDGADEVRTATV